MNEQEYNTNTGFCPAPWTSVYLNPDGRVDNCCISMNKLGNLVNEKFLDIIANDKNIKVKQSMLDGKLPTGCASCDNTSFRTLKNEFVQWFGAAPKELFASVDNFKLKYLDLRWRNTCNFACVYCNSELSSTWAQELGKFPKISKDQHQTLQKYIVNNIADLDYVYLAGGEPLLIKENEAILEQLYVENPNCHIRVNTNLSVIKDNKIFELLTKFKKVSWIISSEGIGDKYEYVRFGGNWQEFEDNLYTVRDLTKARPPGGMGAMRMSFSKPEYKLHTVTFNSVYCALTILSIFDFIEHIEQLDFDINTITLLYYNNGAGGPLEPRNLPKDVIDQSKTLIHKWLAKYPGGVFANGLTEILNTLDIPYNNDRFTDVYFTINELDTRRNINSKLTFPELYHDK